MSLGRKNLLIWGGLTLALSVGAFVWFQRSAGASAAPSDRDSVAVQRMDFPVFVTAPGVIEAPRSVSVGPPRIPRENRFRLARMVEEGKSVSEGDFLLEFDGSDISRRLREETANFQRVQEEYQKKRSDFDIQIRDLKLQLEQAKADLEKIENKLSRQAELESAIVIEETQIRREAARKKLELLEKKFTAANESGRLDLQISRGNEMHYRSRMDVLMDAIDALTVTAPAAGVVIYKRDWNNEPRQVGNFVFVLDTVLEIPDLSMMRVKAMVDEVDAGRISVGHAVRILVDAVQGRVFQGKITSISAILKQAAFDRPQKIAETLIEIEGKDLGMLRPGMNARGQVQVGIHRNVLVIPMSSIQEREGRSFVQVWNRASRAYDWREVQLMTNDGSSAVVSSGLNADENIRLKPTAVKS